MENEKKRRGPKPKPPSEVRRNSFTFRIKDGMRAKLIDAAAASGRPMSEEVERRVEASFDQPALVDRLAERLVSHTEQIREWAHYDKIQREDRFIS